MNIERLVIIRADGFVSINGRGLVVDLSDLPTELHAVQWYGTAGHIERNGAANEPITSLGDFVTCIERWQARADELDAPPPPPTTEQIVEGFKAAIQQQLDASAQAKGYDSIVSACSYAGYANDFQAEAVAFGVWRASVWTYGYAELDKVIAGTRPLPTIAEILAELPALVLP